MSVERTFSIVKPDAVAANQTGDILAMIQQAGFKLLALRMTRLTDPQARGFYAVHKERPFYGELVEFMSSGHLVAAILEKDNAVEDFRKLIGATNPANAEEGTIRKKYAESIGRNAVHADFSGDPDVIAAVKSAKRGL